jgi:hypothetical protein
VDQFADPKAGLGRQLLEGLRLRISDIGRLLVPGMFKAYGRPGQWLHVSTAVYVPVLAAVGVGWWMLVRRRPDVLAMMFPFYLGLYIVWPFGQATRFMMPMLPVLWGCVGNLVVGGARGGCVPGGGAAIGQEAPSRRHADPPADRALDRQGGAFSSRRAGLLVGLIAAHLVVSLIYWGVWLRGMSGDNRDWSVVDRLAAGVGGDREPGVFLADSNSASIRLMFCFTLDRDWPRVAGEPGVPTQAAWIVTNRLRGSVSGFVPQVQAGDFLLLHRRRDTGTRPADDQGR